MQEINEETTTVQPISNKDTAASIGKFESPEALYKSYISLQRDYTRKCQMLKERDNSAATAEGNPDHEREIEELLKKIPELSSVKDELYGLEGSAAERLAGLVLKNQKQADYQAIISDIVSDRELREKIFNELIEDYVSELPPKPVKNRGITALTAVSKPRNLAEATSLARKIIKARRIE